MQEESTLRAQLSDRSNNSFYALRLSLRVLLLILFFVAGVSAQTFIDVVPAMPEAAPPDGTGRVNVSWNCPYNYTIIYYDLNITYNNNRVVSQRYQVNDTIPGEHSPMTDHYVWNVPEGTPQGVYRAELNIMTKESGMIQHLGAYVKFLINDVGRLVIYKYEDRNCNGVNDPDERGLAGWQFKLISPTNEIYTYTTDASGFIKKDRIATGIYQIKEIEQPRYKTTQHVDTVAVVKGETASVTFGNCPRYPNLTIIAFQDDNKNGQKDEGERPSPGINFSIDGPISFKEISDSQGRVQRTLDHIGDYIVTEYLENGQNPTTPEVQNVSLDMGDDKVLYFGIYQKPELEVVVFDDPNRNGIRDPGESGVSQWGLKISGPGSYNESVFTDLNGKIFRKLDSGTYTIKAYPRHRWIFTTPDEMNVSLKSGEQHMVEFGVSDPDYRQYIICYHDMNANGQQDEGEPGLENWTFDIEDISGNLSELISTDQEGRIPISKLPAGRYTVSERLKSNEWYNTTPLSLTVDVPGADIYFGNDMYRKLRVFKFNDSNNNKEFDANEEALSGWEFQVDGQTNKTGSNGIAEFWVRANQEYMLSENITSTQSHDGWQNSTPRKIKVFINHNNSSKEVRFGNHKMPPNKPKNGDCQCNGTIIVIPPTICLLPPENQDMCFCVLVNCTMTVIPCSQRKADLVIAVDTSGSIIEDDYNALKRIDEGITSFVEHMQRSSRSGLRIGLVSWDSDIDESIPPTTRYADILNASHRLSANPNELTMYHIGMEESISSLNMDPRSDARKVIVFITDARNEYEPFTTNLSESGVRVYVLLLGGVQMNTKYQMLEDLVGMYNGQIFMVNSSQDIASALSNITSECLDDIGDITLNYGESWSNNFTMVLCCNNTTHPKPPVLSNATARRDCNSAGQPFIFSVVYKDENGDEVKDANIRIVGYNGNYKVFDTMDDRSSVQMVKGPGKPSSGILYTCKISLPAADEYYYKFYFSNQNGEKVELPQEGLSSPKNWYKVNTDKNNCLGGYTKFNG